MITFGCMNTNTGLTEYVYSWNRMKNLPAPYGKPPYVQYEIAPGTKKEQYTWDAVAQQVTLDPNYQPPSPQREFSDVRNKIFSCQFQYIGTLNNTDYLYSWSDITGGGQERSGDQSNGYRFSNSSPILCPISGFIKAATFSLKGAAVSTGTPAQQVTLNLEIWKVGFNGEGTKLGDLNVDIDSSQNVVGNWWNSSVNTDFSLRRKYEVAVSEGDMLALKFVRIQNSSNVVEFRNLTVCLQIEEKT